MKILIFTVTIISLIGLLMLSKSQTTSPASIGIIGGADGPTSIYLNLENKAE